jgi:adenine/guanine phosphoribosyltransferase-like PRPP-binding protein
LVFKRTYSWLVQAYYIGPVGALIKVIVSRQGGLLVGAEVAGRRVLLLDDVITAGTAIRGSVELLRAAGAVVVGVVVCLDRQERVTDQSTTSAVQVNEVFGAFCRVNTVLSCAGPCLHQTGG